MIEEDGIEGLPGVFRAWAFALGLSVRAWPLAAFGSAAVTVAMGLAPLAEGFVLREVVSRGGSASFWLLGILLAGLLARPLTQPVSTFFAYGYGMRFHAQAVQMLMATAIRPAGIEHVESPKFKDLYQHVSENSWQLANLLLFVADIGVYVLSALVAGTVLARTDPVLLIPVLAAAATGLIVGRSRKRAIEKQQSAMGATRMADALAAASTQPGPAKDIRAFLLESWLQQRWRAARSEVVRTMIKAEAGTVPASALAGVFQALLLGGGLVLLVQRAATRGTAGGDVVLAAVLLRNALSSAETLGAYSSNVAGTTFFAKRLLWLTRYRAPIEQPAAPLDVPRTMQDGIRFENVSFHYPETEKVVLDGVTIHMRAGSTVALVGDNGAGKSTIVKLLLRFYDPSAGRITVGGVDLRNLDVEGWRQRATGAFQDYIKLEVLAREAVGAGRLDALDDLDAVQRAAAGGGAAPVLEALPEKYDTQLGRTFPDGTDLSQGEWQKVAISRAQMRTDPLIVVLDEPTAALDARAEHELFERYAQMAESARERGAVTLLVSHRFSTVQVADHIVVMENGRAVEQGSHRELLAAGGQYAEMYRLQAGRYL